MTQPLVYVDTSAAASLLKTEAHSLSLREWLVNSKSPLISSALLETELRRVAMRTGASQTRATAILTRIAQVQMDQSILRSAGQLSGPFLRSLDAIHIQTAMTIGARAVLTYDKRMMEAAEYFGIEVLAPA